MGARVVGARDLTQRTGQLTGVTRLFQGALQRGALVRAASGAPVQLLDDPKVESVGVEEPGVDAPWEGFDPVDKGGEVLGYRVSAVRGEGQYLPGTFQALAGEAHVLLAPAGDVLQAASVNDAHVRDNGALQGAA